MKSEANFSIDKMLNSLLGRVLLVVLAAVLAAVITPLLFRVNRSVPWPLLKWAVVAIVAVISGLGSRWLLARRTGALRLWTTLLALLCGLIMLGATTQGIAGAQLPSPSQSGLNLTWLGQFLFGVLLAWLALSAWGSKPILPKRPSAVGRSRRAAPRPTAGRRPQNTPQRSTGAARPAAKPPAKPVVGGITPAARSVEHRPTTRLTPAPTWKRAWSDRWQRLNTRLQAWWESGLHRPTPPASPPPSLGWWKRRNLPRLRSLRGMVAKPGSADKKVFRAYKNPTPRSMVRLVGQEEHRCPYCLELVAPNDPRGFVECDICHTRHHADCWAVTGACQVPHYHG